LRKIIAGGVIASMAYVVSGILQLEVNVSFEQLKTIKIKFIDLEVFTSVAATRSLVCFDYKCVAICFLQHYG
jgi:hypothetical protein